MVPTPTPLTHRLRRARTKDVPAIRAFFDRVLKQGSEAFDAMDPTVTLLTHGFLPAYDLWMARSRGIIVAAGWFHLGAHGRVIAAALTDPEHDTLTSPLLACIEAALQVIAYDGRYRILELTAWVPDGEHHDRIASTYLRRGWTAVSRPWLARLHRASLRRGVVSKVVVQARVAGIDLRSATDQMEELMRSLPEIHGSLHPIYRFADLWEASEQGRVLAVNGVQDATPYGRVISTEPVWRVDVQRSEMVADSLLGLALFAGNTLPDALIGFTDLSRHRQWFEGEIEVVSNDGYTRPIDASREPEAWEFGLGFNPDRVWLQLRG